MILARHVDPRPPQHVHGGWAPQCGAVLQHSELDRADNPGLAKDKRPGLDCHSTRTDPRLALTLDSRVEGLDLEIATALNLDALADLLCEHLVVALPDQNLTVDHHVEFGHRFGEPLIHSFLEAVREHPAVLQVLKEPHDRETFGGDTLFASQFAVYDALSSPMKLMLDRLTAAHIYPDMPESTATTAIHSVIRSHPVSGRKAIFVNPAFTDRIEELADDAGQSGCLALRAKRLSRGSASTSASDRDGATRPRIVILESLGRFVPNENMTNVIS